MNRVSALESSQDSLRKENDHLADIGLEKEATVDRLKQELESVSGAKASLEAELETALEQHDDLSRKEASTLALKDELEAQLQSIGVEKEVLEKELVHAKNSVSKLESSRDSLQNENDRLADICNEREATLERLKQELESVSDARAGLEA